MARNNASLGPSHRRRRGFGAIRRLPSRRYQASFISPDGERIVAPTTFEVKMDAEAWLATNSAAVTEGRWKKPKAASASELTFQEYAEDWLRRRELKPRTRREYERMLELLLERFSGKRLEAISPDTVRRWYESLDPTRPTRRAHQYALLRTIMGTAVTDEVIDANPCRLRGAGKSKRARKIRPATLAELKEMTEALPDQWQMLLQLAAWCALRFGELTELRRMDVDLVNGVLCVSRGVTWVNGEAIVGEPKSEAGIRDVAIPPHLIPPLQEHLARFVQPARAALLFPAVGGAGHLNHGTLYKAFRRARSAAGREDLRLHDMRHTGAVMAAQAGATTRELMDRLGHTTAEMAMRYQHVAEGRQAEIARRLSLMAQGPVPGTALVGDGSDGRGWG